MSSEDSTPTEQVAPPPAPPPVSPAPPGQTWGAAPRQERPRWSGRRTAIAIAVAVVIAGGGGAAIAAAAGSSSSSSNGPGGAPGQFGGMNGMNGMTGRGGAGGEFAMLGSALHGDFVVRNGSGGYRTERLQRGKVTASSGTSLTVASDDGFTTTYVINSSTSLDDNDQKVTSIPTGQTVTVVATLSGATGNAATATTVEEGTEQQGGPVMSGGSAGPGGFGPGN